MSKNFQKIKVFILTLIWVGFLGVQKGGGGKITPYLKLVRITPQPYVVSENIPFSTLLNFADFSFFCKKIAFFVQKSTFTQSNSVRAVLETF